MNDIKEKIADYINQHKSSLLYDINHRSIEQSVMRLINGNKAAGDIINIDDTTIKERVYKEIGQQEIRQALQIKENGNVICNQDGFMIYPRPPVYHDDGTTRPPQQQERLQINSFDVRILSKYNLIFRECEFNAKLLAHCDFKCHLATFKNCIFKKRVNFSNAKFCNDVYFNNSHFYDSADFHECEFEKTACFYGATFEKSPNFSQAIFKGSLNIVNTNLNFDFENLNERIKQECQNFNANKGQENKKTLDKFANDFRDSFRLIKNALIKDNNLLDASNFHKYELYCKEIELEQMWHKQGKTAETEADIKRNTHKFRDYIDCLLLGFYRKLCEHHTDFLKVFNNLILLIVLYALFFKGIAYLHNAKIENINEEFILSKISNNFEFYFNLGLIIFIVLGSILILCKINKNFFIDFIRFCFKKLNFYKRFHCNIRQSFKNFMIFLKILIKDLWYLIESLILAFFFAYAFYVLLVGFGGKIIDLNKDYGYSLFINTLFVGLYISLVYTKSLIIGRYILLIASYMGFFIVLIKYPSIIHPLIGKIADTDKTCTCPSIMALSILYTILIFLVLFSLQKTARKNSIVPH